MTLIKELLFSTYPLNIRPSLVLQCTKKTLQFNKSVIRTAKFASRKLKNLNLLIISVK